MTDSILTNVKGALGLAPDYDAFDAEIVMHINSTFSTLSQLGIGPVDGFVVEDDTQTWTEFLGADKRYAFVKTYVYQKVKLVFDPPTTGFVLTSIEKQITELEWRINAMYEDNKVVDDVVVGDVLI